MHRDRERRGLAARGLHLVEAQARDCAYAMTKAKLRSDLGKGREWYEIRLDELAPGRVVLAGGGDPAVAIEQFARGGVDVVLPGREDAHVAPLQHARANRIAGLEDQRGRATLDQVRRG